MRSAWFMPLKPMPARRAGAVLCFHFGGGSSTAFRAFAPHVPADVALIGVDLPGRAARFGEKLITSVADAVASLLRDAHELDALGPFVFFGHSLGALIAFELARGLERARGPLPRRVFASGRGAPHVPVKPPHIHALPDALFLEELKRYEGTPDEVLANRELMEIFLPILRADFTVSETYRGARGAPIATPITVLGGASDAMVDAPRLGEWREHTRGDFALRVFDGGHFFIDQHRAEIARMLTVVLGERPDMITECAARKVPGGEVA